MYVPPIAAWIETNEAYSNNRCLCFVNYHAWDKPFLQEIIEHTERYNKGFRKLIADRQDINSTPSTEFTEEFYDQQYRTLNQIQKVYDKFDDGDLRPFSSLTIKFKMKTTHCVPLRLSLIHI